MLENIWYLESEEYDNYYQWLPREIHEDIVPLLTCFIERHLDKDWHWGYGGLSSNPSITLEFVEKHIDKDWNYGSDPFVTPEFIERHMDRDWNWKHGISNNPSVTPEFIERHMDRDWNWKYGLSSNPIIFNV